MKLVSQSQINARRIVYDVNGLLLKVSQLLSFLMFNKDLSSLNHLS